MSRGKRKYKKIDHKQGTVSEVNKDKVKIDQLAFPEIPFEGKSNRQLSPRKEFSAEFEVKDKEKTKIKNQFELINKKEKADIEGEPLKISVKRKDFEVGDTDDLRTHEVVSVLADIYPQITDHYVLYRHADARGYEILNDGTLVEINGEIIDDFDAVDQIDDIDFLWVSSTTTDSIHNHLEGRKKLYQSLPRYDRHKRNEMDELVNNVFGRSFVVGVLGDSGRVYAVRIERIQTKRKPRTIGKPTLRLQRIKAIKDDPTTIRVREVYNRQNVSPRSIDRKKELK